MLMRLMLLLMMALSAGAQTTLWKVTCNGKTLYLGGTVHMLRSTDYPLPAAFDRAFSASDSVVFETDIGGLETLETARQIQTRLLYEPPMTLRDALNRETYMALKKYVVGHGLPMELFDRMKPPMAVMSLITLELQQLGMAAPGVDAYYFAQAVRDGKRVEWFESLQEQIDILADMGTEDVDAMILESLDEVAQYKVVMAEILQAWRTGDTEALADIGRKYLLNERSGDYRRLIVDRNRRWMARLIPMTQSPETEFVLVGALHLVGKEGLIAQLGRRGCRIEQL